MTRHSTTAILARLRAVIDAQETTPGRRLPDERTLSAALGCSRQTLRQALFTLESEGAIWRHVGQGTFVGPRPDGHPIREALLLQATSPLQLMQARLIIEPPIAAEAARVAMPSDIDRLRHIVAEGRRARSRAECERHDAAFHRAIAEIARNPILLGLLDYLAGARRRVAWQQQWDRTYRRIGASEFTGLHCDQHTAVIDAMAARSGFQSEEAMRRHLEVIARAMEASV
ncbi:MAG: FadR family transcriptional regulator [Bosea sp.]|uniref:FadR/GntR family transcriptional regulator n=1 Tax=Bosea sp. (in: a-proteobacteria) TaxID=1871050 RepID=UPI001AC33176|nr:FCD domain-containing protein [Bosea sp. (in: a-proteobacteria)]MBN9451256.1 FadR family transcriptional regulator [Bosea sp. (in: a-proteobacteria)]